MKKNLLLSSFVISALSANAQITITSSDMPIAGQAYIMANDTNVTSFGSAGANQTWNFGAWTNHTKDTTSFYAPSYLPGASFFPTATLSTGDSTSSGFMKSSSSSFDLLGFYADFGSGSEPATFTPAQKLLTFPSTYLTSYNGTSKYNIQFFLGQSGIDSIRSKSAINYSSSIDGWGSITTPSNVNVSSLRQKYTEIRSDTTYLKYAGQPWTLSPPSPGNPNPRIDTTTTYRWWTNAKKFIIAEITTNGNNVITYANYQLSVQVGVNEQSIAKKELDVFPNPASDKINISGILTESYVFIFDVNGKLIEKGKLKKGNTTINTSNYESGTYFYQVIAMNGKPLGSGKFMVSK